MKRILTIAAALLAGSQLLSAQEPTTEGTHVYNSIVSRTDDTEGNHTWNINVLGIGDDRLNLSLVPGTEKANGWDVDFGVSHAYIGWSELNSKDVDLRPGNSLEFGFNVLTIDKWNHSRTTGFEMGIACSWTRYSHKNGKVLYNDADGRTIYDRYDLQGNGDDYSKSRLTYASWRMPMMFKVRNASRTQQFAIGAEAELRHHLRSRIKVGKNKKFYAEGHDLAVNPVGCNLLVSYANDGITIFGRYGLTEFFDKDHTSLSAHPFMIGIGFGL